MQIVKAARRYAKALLELAVELDKLDEVRIDVEFVNSTLEDSKDLVLMFKSPIIKEDDKRAVLHRVFDEHLSDITLKFLDLLVKKDREDLVDQIFAAFVDAYNDYAGILNISVYSSASLTDKQESKLRNALKDRTGKTIKLSKQVDESLKGGIAVRIEDTVIDGTIKHKIEQLEALFAHSIA